VRRIASPSPRSVTFDIDLGRCPAFFIGFFYSRGRRSVFVARPILVTSSTCTATARAARAGAFFC